MFYQSLLIRGIQEHLIDFYDYELRPFKFRFLTSSAFYVHYYFKITDVESLSWEWRSHYGECVLVNLWRQTSYLNIPLSWYELCRYNNENPAPRQNCTKLIRACNNPSRATKRQLWSLVGVGESKCLAIFCNLRHDLPFAVAFTVLDYEGPSIGAVRCSSMR